MSLTTGTYTNYGSEFQFPSGTIVSPTQVVGFPELSMGERNTTNHGSGGFEERRPNGLKAAGDFTLSLLSTRDVSATLKADKDAGTERICYLKNPINGYIFTGWIKNFQEEGADAENPDSVKLMITVVPVGAVTIV